MSKKRALIVEDAGNWVKRHELSLRELGFATVVADDYAEALGRLRRERFEVAVIDLCLMTDAEPENLNGVFLLEHLVEKNIPVIVVTGRSFRKLVDTMYHDFDVFEILDKLSFNPEKFKEYVLQATRYKPGVTNDFEKKKTFSRKKIEALVVEFMKGGTMRPQKMEESWFEIDPTKTVKASRIFISHSAKDKNFAGRLANDLHAAGFEVWYDSNDIQVGDTIFEKMAQGAAACDYMVIILSPDSVASWMVKQEIMMFLNEERRRGHSQILPILYKDCPIPPLLEGRHYADFRESYEAGWAELSRGLDIGKSLDSNS